MQVVGIMILFDYIVEKTRLMTVSIYSLPVNARTVDFNRHKYGRELLIDVAEIRAMPAFARTVEPYQLTFYDVTLITGGSGAFWLDDKQYPLTPGQLLFTSPGQIRRWYVNNLSGICLFFPAEFFQRYFSDPLLLHQLQFFRGSQANPDLLLEKSQQDWLKQQFTQMQSELKHLQEDSESLLAYQCAALLIQLNRWFSEHYHGTAQPLNHTTIMRFKTLLDRHFSQYHHVQEYAAMLGVTPGHLNVLCKQQMHQTASQMIQQRIYIEAKRRLMYSNLPVEALSEALGFSHCNYFCRAFKRDTGYTPLQYRKLNAVQHPAMDGPV